MINNLLLEYYYWIKSFHIISVISWMAGLFYLPRIFVYHVEKPYKNLHKIYEEMEFKLLNFIMNPAMILTWIFGILLIITPGIAEWNLFWLWIKIISVFLMSYYHYLLILWRKNLAKGHNNKSGRFYRLANEVPTFLMIIIVIMVIVRPF